MEERGDGIHAKHPESPSLAGQSRPSELAQSHLRSSTVPVQSLLAGCRRGNVLVVDVDPPKCHGCCSHIPSPVSSERNAGENRLRTRLFSLRSE